ncbi:MAG: hypothetical protein ABH823_03830 [bacterium]
MTATYGVFGRQMAFNKYPTRWRLPGHQTEKGQQIRGIARNCIVHALTYHELPSNIDSKISKVLPRERDLDALNAVRRDYLSFTVYSIKQMVAAGTISADTAWSLFEGEWGEVNKVTRNSYEVMRRVFWQKTLHGLGEEFGAKKLGELQEKYFDDGRGEVDLLRFEFLARAGEAGLAQYERFAGWADAFQFDPVSCQKKSEPIRKEYRKAFWLEMAMIEHEHGVQGMNDDLGAFIFDLNEGEYYSFDENNEFGVPTIRGSIDIFRRRKSKQVGGAVDSTIKAEIAHCFFDTLHSGHAWVAELMDRMNMSVFTERVAVAIAHHGSRPLPPEARVFMTGGYYLASGIPPKAYDYPVFPQRFLKNWQADEEHVVAEHFERLIRDKLKHWSKRQDFEPTELFRFYRKVGLYFALLGLNLWAHDDAEVEAALLEHLVRGVELADIRQVDLDVAARAIVAFQDMLDRGGVNERARAAQGLIDFRGLTDNAKAFKKLDAYRLIANLEWERLADLGKLAFPALRVWIDDEGFDAWKDLNQALLLMERSWARKFCRKILRHYNRGHRVWAANWLAANANISN